MVLQPIYMSDHRLSFSNGCHTATKKGDFLKTFISSGTGFFTIYEGEVFKRESARDISRFYLIWPTKDGWRLKYFDYGKSVDITDEIFQDEHLALNFAYDFFLKGQKKI